METQAENFKEFVELQKHLDKQGKTLNQEISK